MIPRDALSKEDFDRQERGLPPKEKSKVVRVDPKPPVIPDLILFKDIPTGDLFDLNARSRSVKNADGVRFIAWDVYAEDRAGEIVEGTMLEGDFFKLRERARVENPSLITKIGL